MYHWSKPPSPPVSESICPVPFHACWHQRGSLPHSLWPAPILSGYCAARTCHHQVMQASWLDPVLRYPLPSPGTEGSILPARAMKEEGPWFLWCLQNDVVPVVPATFPLLTDAFLAHSIYATHVVLADRGPVCRPGPLQQACHSDQHLRPTVAVTDADLPGPGRLPDKVSQHQSLSERGTSASQVVIR